MDNNNHHKSNESEEMHTFVKKDSFSKHRKMFPAFVVFACLFFILGVVFLVFGIHKYNTSLSDSNCKGSGYIQGKEAKTAHAKSLNVKQTELFAFLSRMKGDFYKLYPDKVGEDPEADFGKVLHRYQPYDPSWQAIKSRTDHALSLRQELRDLDIQASDLRPREKKGLAQAEHYLESIFGNPYDENYYTGDWMLGPNYACWQPFCCLLYTSPSPRDS